MSVVKLNQTSVKDMVNINNHGGLTMGPRVGILIYCYNFRDVNGEMKHFRSPEVLGSLEAVYMHLHKR